MTAGVKKTADVHAMASIDTHSPRFWYPTTTIPVRPAAAAQVKLVIAGVPAGQCACSTIQGKDNTHHNPFEAWKRMGSPAKPNPEQYAELEAAGQLQMVGSPGWVSSQQGECAAIFQLAAPWRFVDRALVVREGCLRVLISYRQKRQ